MTRHYILQGAFILAIGFVVGAAAVILIVPQNPLIWVGGGVIMAVVLLSAANRSEI